MTRMPNAVLTKVRGEGDYVKFTKLRKEVYQNISAVSTTYIAPDDGYLGLGTTDAKYSICTGVHYVVPLDPGIYDVTIRANISHVTRSRREAEHNEARWYFRTNKAVESIIKNRVKQAIPSSLIIEIEDEITGLKNIDIIDILNHVQQRRGKIKDNLIDINNVRFIEPFDATLGMPEYIRQIEEC